MVNDSSSEVGTPLSSGIWNQSSGYGTTPDTLHLKSILCTINITALWVMVPELASLELMFHLVTKFDIALGHVKIEMQKMVVVLPKSIHRLDLCPINKWDISNAMQNINNDWDDLLDHLGGYFRPYDNESLHAWLDVRRGYSTGRRIQADVFDINPNIRQYISPL